MTYGVLQCRDNKNGNLYLKFTDNGVALCSSDDGDISVKQDIDDKVVGSLIGRMLLVNSYGLGSFSYFDYNIGVSLSISKSFHAYVYMTHFIKYHNLYIDLCIELVGSSGSRLDESYWFKLSNKKLRLSVPLMYAVYLSNMSKQDRYIELLNLLKVCDLSIVYIDGTDMIRDKVLSEFLV